MGNHRAIEALILYYLLGSASRLVAVDAVFNWDYISLCFFPNRIKYIPSISHSSSQTPKFSTDCVDFEGKDKPTGFGFHSLLPSPESAYPALALRKPIWVPGWGN